MAKPISSDLVGMTFEPVPFSWDSKDVMLYAVGVGAKPEGELEFVYEGKGPKVLPTYAVIPGMFSMGGLVSNVEINLAMLLHGEQSITLHREIPPEGKVKVTGRIREVWDKGKAAVIGSEGIVEDEKGLAVHHQGDAVHPRRRRLRRRTRSVDGGSERAAGSHARSRGRRRHASRAGRDLSLLRRSQSRSTSIPTSPGWPASRSRSCTACAPTASSDAPFSRPCAAAIRLVSVHFEARFADQV